MKSAIRGKNISGAEVQDITPHGVWLYVKGAEYFLPYAQYPWFINAKVADIYKLLLLHENHLYWPKLDVDLELKSLQNPENYPLIYRTYPRSGNKLK